MIDLAASFIDFRLLDVVDIVAVALLIYVVYRLLKGSMAFNIFIGIAFLYVLWFVVKQLNMELLHGILEQFIGVGVIALLIVFQPEIRRFLLFLGKGRRLRRWHLVQRLLNNETTSYTNEINAIVNAVEKLSASKTGALIIISDKEPLSMISSTGTPLDAKITAPLLESIFQRTTPLHDGAVVISGSTLVAAGCILPISENRQLPKRIGTRHKAGVGITEQSAALAIIVSEETGGISIAKDGVLSMKTSLDLLREAIQDIMQQDTP